MTSKKLTSESIHSDSGGCFSGRCMVLLSLGVVLLSFYGGWDVAADDTCVIVCIYCSDLPPCSSMAGGLSALLLSNSLSSFNNVAVKFFSQSLPKDLSSSET
jgi:hypothetical protein